MGFLRVCLVLREGDIMCARSSQLHKNGTNTGTETNARNNHNRTRNSIHIAMDSASMEIHPDLTDHDWEILQFVVLTKRPV